MPRLYYQHPGTWFGDCMPIFADGAFQLFHQRDTRNPGPFGEPFGWALARTTDFVSYQDLGEALQRGADDAQDQFIFAGSVFEAATAKPTATQGADGRFHAFYTGFNRDFAKIGKPAQVLMHAVSDDLVHWETLDGELVAPEPGYDPHNWRDPYVLRDDDDDRWIMILGARKDGDQIVSGRTVWYTSTDLESWHFEGDFWAPDLYSMHEMPDLFRIGDHWYLLTTEYSDRSKTVYRSSTSLAGPWSAPVDDAFDGRAYYAARSASDGDHRYLFGWVATKEDEDDLGKVQWGGTLVVHEVFQRDDHSLGVRPPQSVLDAFGPAQELITDSQTVAAPDGRRTQLLGNTESSTFLLRLTLRPEQNRSFAIRLFGDEQTGDGYAFTFRTGEQRVDFDRVPNFPWYRYDNRGSERPFTVNPGQTYEIAIIVDETIATLYVDGVALNVRRYAEPGKAIGVDIVDGEVEILSSTLAELPG
ncbi:glycosyl hydrolase family 32 [Microlunatus endophyticus]|nr:glycosyl hydrolase family 32 [Microlunatus endophyticus]